MKRNLTDRLFSLYIRARAHFGCQRCGRVYDRYSQGLHCAHVFSRGKLSLRWTPANALCLCYGCHRLCDQRKETVLYPLYISLYGPAAFDRLRLAANTPTKPDEAGALLWLKRELQTMLVRW